VARRPEQPRYRFGPLERRGLIAGWRGGQVAAVTTGMVIAVGLLRALRPPLDLLAALVVILLGVGMATWPIGGRTCDQWCPVVAAWVLRLAAGSSRHVSSVPAMGQRVPAAAAGSGVGHRAMPPALSGCRLLAPPSVAGGLCMGVLHDARARTYTGVIAVSGAPFALLEADERQRRVAAWSALLASLAREGSPVHRLQWVERDLPGEPSQLTQQMRSAMVLSPDSAAARSYEEVVSKAGRLSRSHQALLALSVRADRSSREIRAFGGGDGGACALLDRELRSLQTALFGAEVLVQGTLSPRVLVDTLRQAIDEWPKPPSRHGPALGGEETAVKAGAWPWPVASETTWATHRTEATWHATYWIAEWPRVDVGPDFLSPVLLHSGVRHTMAVTMEPISPLKAARDVSQARTADLADAEIRRRGGFLTSARRGREAQAVTQREIELADGHAEYRFSGYVTVTARSAEALDSDCVRMEQAAGQARLELRRLYGQQDQAFTWTLPIGRGLS
jgi:hypothetical protein